MKTKKIISILLLATITMFVFSTCKDDKDDLSSTDKEGSFSAVTLNGKAVVNNGSISIVSGFAFELSWEAICGSADFKSMRITLNDNPVISWPGSYVWDGISAASQAYPGLKVWNDQITISPEEGVYKMILTDINSKTITYSFSVTVIPKIVTTGSFSSVKVNDNTVSNNTNISLANITSFTLKWTAIKGDANLKAIRIIRDGNSIIDLFGYHWYGDDIHSQASSTQYSTWNESIELAAISGSYTMTLWDTEGNYSDFTFTLAATCPPNQVVDICLNVYKTVTIGTQTWMAENLSTTSYNNGEDIPNESDMYNWIALTTPARCLYTGWPYRLYNWFAVNTGKLAPVGWHVATDADWSTLTKYVSAHLGYSSSVNKALASKIDWSASTTLNAVGNNLGNNNSTGFSALPSGVRGTAGYFNDVGNIAAWWTSTSVSAGYAGYREMTYDNTNVMKLNTNYQCGLAVRCVKD